MYSDFAWWKSATTVMIIYLLSIYKELFYSRGIIEFTIIKYNYVAYKFTKTKRLQCKRV